MIKNIPESLKEKLKGKEEELEKAVLELREYAKKDLGETVTELEEAAKQCAERRSYLSLRKGELVETYNLSAKESFIEGAIWHRNHVWHDSHEVPGIDKNIILVSPNHNVSLALWDGKGLISCTLGGGHDVIKPNDKWAYIEDIL